MARNQAQHVTNTLADESFGPLSSFVDKIFKFPLFPMVAGLVVLFLTVVLAVIGRCRRIRKVNHNTVKAQRLDLDSPKRTQLMLYSLLTVLQIGFHPCFIRFEEAVKTSPLGFPSTYIWYLLVFNILVVFPLFPFTFYFH